MTSGFIRVVQAGQADMVYVGPERREERRRSVRNDEFEKLLGHFGLNRRVVPDRRRGDTSWLLLSETAIDRAVSL
ncbi:hypothetical protein HPT27_08100 [Permianibacter sp. IMCC34836]|uniref:hypothetical protein n=1 Tax=Permianibacter fluminis TaxID=2738515 RepID=UPI001555EF85|nr:hypothetical protein [Permianibacter fluminis]NQD36984.1 hypothetical protein [Permianibacter fluminis]